MDVSCKIPAVRDAALEISELNKSINILPFLSDVSKYARLYNTD
jgi:hypothetical protein